MRKFVGGLSSLLLLMGAMAQDASQVADTGQQEGGPLVWTNWHKTVECRPASLAYPTSVQEVSALVRAHRRVRAVGAGHSFNRMTCSDDLMISTEKLDQAIELNRGRRTVVVQAGMKTRALMEWLAERRFSLPTYPYYIDQTIGGAVATDTHGSSTSVGSLSSLLRSLKLVMADGRVRTLTPADGEVWDAARVSVGFLGVMVELELAVVPDAIVDRNAEVVGPMRMLAEIGAAAINPLVVDQVQYFYNPESGRAIRTSVGPRTAGAGEVQDNRGTQLSNIYYSTVANTPAVDDYWSVPVGIMQSNDPTVVDNWLLASIWGSSAEPGTFRLSDALPVQPKISTESLLRAYGKYDQYEFAVPIEKGVQCFSAFLDIVDSDPEYQRRFRVPMLVRFVRDEDQLLGITRGGTRVYFNIDNYHAHTEPSGVSPAFEKVKALMRSPTCDARVHFGKASVYSVLGGGWTEEDAEYVRRSFTINGSFDRFLEIVHSMDPSGKFADADGLIIPH